MIATETKNHCVQTQTDRDFSIEDCRKCNCIHVFVDDTILSFANDEFPDFVNLAVEYHCRQMISEFDEGEPDAFSDLISLHEN